MGDAEAPRYRFGTPRRLDELSVAAKTDNPSLTADLLQIYFTSERNGGAAEIFVAERASRELPFGLARPVEALNAAGVETGTAVSGDGLSIWFASDRPGGQGGLDIWFATRSSRDGAWSSPENLGELNTSGNEIPRPVGQRGRVMPMASDFDTPPYYRIHFAQRAEPDAPFGAPEPRPELAFPDESTVDAFLTDDGLTLFYVTGPAFGPADLYVAARRSTSEPFEQPRALDELNTPSDERDPWLSPDGSELYFASDRAGAYDIYVVDVLGRVPADATAEVDGGAPNEDPPRL